MPTAPEILTGPDCSWHQGVVDWNKVRGGGHSFGVCKLTDATSYRHVDWGLANIPKVRSAGLIPGAYHWLDAGPNGELRNPREQARYFVDSLRKVGGPAGIFPVVDQELERDSNGAVVSKPMIDSTHIFADEFYKLGGMRLAFVYTGKWYWDLIGNPYAANVARLWHSEYEPTIAEVADGPELDHYGGWTHAKMWQFTSNDRGLGMDVPGVDGLCDLNRFFGSRDELLALTRPNLVSTPDPIPSVKESDMAFMVHNEKGATLLVTGNASLLITSAQMVANHAKAGIPNVPCDANQFSRYEKMRIDKTDVEQTEV